MLAAHALPREGLADERLRPMGRLADEPARHLSDPLGRVVIVFGHERTISLGMSNIDTTND